MSTDEVQPDGAPRDGPTSSSDHVPAVSTERRVRSRRRLVFRAMVIAVLALVGYYSVSLWQVWSTGRSDQAREVDAIVVMGAAQYDGRPSPQLVGRLDHVIELWPRDLAPMVVVTGGKQPGDRFTEAETSAQYLVERGIPESAIVLENDGRSTFESLRNVADLLVGTSGGEKVSVLVVTDPYHSLRSRLIAQDVGLIAYVSPTEQSVIQGGRSVRRNLLEAGGVAVGRVVGFGRL